LFKAFLEVKEELEDKPMFYEDPHAYFMEQLYDAHNTIDDIVEDYEKLYTKATFLIGQLKRMDFKHKLLDEPIKRYTKETRREKKQWSNKGSLQGTR